MRTCIEGNPFGAYGRWVLLCEKGLSSGLISKTLVRKRASRKNIEDISVNPTEIEYNNLYYLSKASAFFVSILGIAEILIVRKFMFPRKLLGLSNVSP